MGMAVDYLYSQHREPEAGESLLVCGHLGDRVQRPAWAIWQDPDWNTHTYKENEKPDLFYLTYDKEAGSDDTFCQF